MLGRTTETIPPVDLARVVLGIAGLPGGYSIAVELLTMHFHPPADVPLHWDPALVDCGRQLLRTCPAGQINQSTDYELAEIAKVCLQGPEAAAAALPTCQWIADAITERPSLWFELDALIETLLTLQPEVALNCWFDDTQNPSQVPMWRLAGNEDRNPFGKVPTLILLDWAAQDMATRVLRLADVIPVFDAKADPLAWSESALALLDAAPNRATLFQRLAERVRLRGRSGSPADIRERRPLIQQFFGDQNPAVGQVAREIDSYLQREIAAEAAREVNRDERFE